MTYLFSDMHQNNIVDQQRAELYMRLYQYGAKDFVNNQDFTDFVKDLIQWMESVEERAQTLSSKLSSHVHTIPAHTHPMPTHTHMIMPHIHPTAYGPSGPNQPVPTDIGTLTTTLSSSPFESTAPTKELNWGSGSIPKMYVNTTGVVSNMNNKVVVSSGVIGDSSPHERRSEPEAKTLTPNIPPYLKPNPV